MIHSVIDYFIFKKCSTKVRFGVASLIHLQYLHFSLIYYINLFKFRLKYFILNYWESHTHVLVFFFSMCTYL